MSRHSNQLSTAALRSFTTQVATSLPQYATMFPDVVPLRHTTTLSEDIAALLPPHIAEARYGGEEQAVAAASRPRVTDANAPITRVAAMAHFSASRPTSRPTSIKLKIKFAGPKAAAGAPMAFVRGSSAEIAARLASTSALSAAAPAFVPAAVKGHCKHTEDRLAAVAGKAKNGEGCNDTGVNDSTEERRDTRGAKKFRLRPNQAFHFSRALKVQDWKDDGWMTFNALYPATAASR